MLKKILLALTAVSLFFTIIAASETGIKFAINTQVINLIKGINLSEKLANTTIIGSEGVTYKKDSFPSVALKVSDLIIVEIKSPEGIQFDTNKEERTMQLHLKTITANLNINYELKVASILKDSGKKTNIDIVLDDCILGLQFTGDKVLVKSLNFKIAKVDFSLNQFILNLILKMFKSTIISKLNQSVVSLRMSLEQQLNTMIQTERLFDLGGMGIGVNATLTEMPNMELYDNSRILKSQKGTPFVKVFVDLVQQIFETEQGISAGKFLSIESEQPKIKAMQNSTNTQDENTTSFLIGGIRGSIFATIMKDLKPKIPEPFDMQFTERYLKNKINLLISDYTINTLLFFVQQSGYINIRIQNETNSYFPFNVDIDGFKSLFPNLTQNYNENFPVEVKMNILSNADQPQITTDSDGSKISINYAFELKVYNSTDIFDDPITELKLNVNSYLKLQYQIDDEYLYIIVFRNQVVDVEEKVNSLGMGKDDIMKSIKDIQEKILAKFQPSFAKVNVEELLHNTLGYKFDSFEFDSRKGFLEISVDMPEI